MAGSTAPDAAAARRPDVVGAILAGETREGFTVAGSAHPDGGLKTSLRNWQTKSLAGSKHPRLQILTIEELLAGRKIDMPAQQEIRSFKQAPKARGKKPDQAHLF